jgi:endonuclease/exonuclease/phosphatase family metal-dependent hydrolase
MRVVTFNVQHGRSARGPIDVPLLATTCAELGADVLGLQEVDRGVERSGRADLAAEVAQAAGMHAVFGMAMETGGGEYGNALLARLPIGDLEVVALPRVLRRSERRVAVLGTVDGLRFAVAHLAFQKSESPAQLDALVAAGADVLLGDLNLRPRRLGAVARSGYELAGGGPTFPARPFPFSRIDHVAVRPPLRIHSVEVVRTPCSDHLALAVEVG